MYPQENEDIDAQDAVVSEILPSSGENRPPKKGKPPFWFGVFLGIIIGILATGAVMIVQTAVLYKSGYGYEDKIETILAYLEAYSIYDIDDQLVEDATAEGLLSGIGDTYARYYTAEEYAEYQESSAGEYAGIGVQVVWAETGAEIYKVYSNSPAEEVGLQVGDIIIGADGVADFEDLDSLVAAVKGEAGTSVVLTVLRDEEEIEVEVERAEIEIDVITYEMLDGNIGYIYISEFAAVAEEQFYEALDSLEADGMESLIIDLRDNPGGDYDTVVAMCDRVLPEGVIITVEDKDGNTESEYSDEENQVTVPMVVLINGNTASASEVFAGALQDYGLAVLVGEQSYGKGVVQSIFSLSDGSGIKFTTKIYYTPNGTCVDGVGLTPDVEVSIPDEAYDDGELTDDEDTQLQTAIEILSE